MLKITLFGCLTLFSMAASAEHQIAEDVRSVAQLLTDQYAVLVEHSISVIKDDQSDVIFATFSIEGFQGGNNFQPFIVAFKPEFRTEDSPPFQRIGAPKYRMLGIRHLCPSPSVLYRHDSLAIHNGEVTGVCETGDSESEFTVEVGPYDLLIEH
ncbi:hypothetical protein BGP77_06615 [Saccharospirillum sp. MSK14-1]|uniref:hypothetical protein n=1 Tax=Saccharospirillum sp. MSK14-1 TaxID=1897632 RepID=UPI000D34A376|nr:hypothetical protein [Saccharospirillum sp. MSK14-1]PTY36952.1 hypothetical protein BGP77_06615 [Saccharospirillum sp. MSK14-1]